MMAIRDYNFAASPRLKSCWWEQGEAIMLGKNGVTKIEVIPECGEMSMVYSWVGVWYEDGRFFKHNMRYIFSCEVLTGEEERQGEE